MSDDLVEQYRQLQKAIGGCHDGYCVVRKPKGQHTNGGCTCLEDLSLHERSRIGHLLRCAQGMDDRIEELEASKNEALNQLDSALYSVSVLEKRVRFFMDENADLKAKLAKAVKCLQSLIIEYDKVDLAYDEPKTMTAVYGVALDTIAELTSSVAADDEVKGGKDG